MSDGGRAPDHKRRRFRARYLVLAVLGMAVAGVLFLLRDPTPYFLERRSQIASVASTVGTPEGGHVIHDLRLTAKSGLRVEMSVKRPVAPTSAPGHFASDTVRRPLVVILGGRGTGRDAVKLVGNTNGAIVAALSYPYHGKTKFRGLEIVGAVPEIRRAILDTPPSLILALDHLLAGGGVDTTRVELLGVSFGTPFAVIAGALDQRWTRVWSIHGAGSPYTLISHGLRKRIPFTPARAVVAGLANLLASGPRVAPERWVARISPRPFVMINAEADERLPREAVMSLYERAREPKELTWMPGQHVQGNRTEIVLRLVEMVLERLGGIDVSSVPRVSPSN